MRGAVLTIVFFAALVATLGWLTWSVPQVECEVCIDFKGLRNCATAAAATKEEAMRGGRTTACAALAGGVRDSFACDATRPSVLRCR